MHTNILLPQVELTMESVLIVGWLVNPGDHVNAEQPILEVESQKGIVEVPSTVSGYVRKLCVNKGDTIGEKALICIVTETSDEPLSDFVAAVADDRPAEKGAPCPTSAVTAEGGGIRAVPAARKLAKELGIDLTSISGTGPGGRISVEDVQRCDKGVMETLPAARLASIVQMQKSLAEIPQFHVARQMEVGSLTAKADGITFTHRLVRAVAAALAKHPALHTTIHANRFKVEAVSVAVAIDTPRGLVAPAVRNADRLSLEQIAAQVKDLRSRAEAGRLKREEMADAPFAISNLGMWGVDFFHAFVYHGQTAVLAVGQAMNGKAWFSLTVDHRIVDGVAAAQFLETLQKEILT